MGADRGIWLRAKRLFDVIIGTIGLGLLLLPFSLIAVAIKLDDHGPVFFRQTRIGKGGRPFRVWKLRTMIPHATAAAGGHTLRATDERITRVGRVLRALGFDELPQLLNVLSGSMSLVGPRPTVPYQVQQYDDFQRRRLEMKPGITSLAVVSGRNALSWNDRIELDVWYVDHWSMRLDLSILFRTLWKVLVTREGLYGPDGVNDTFVPPPDATDSEGAGE